MKKQFTCNGCGELSEKDSSSYYKQKKKLGFLLCRKCGIKHGNKNMVRTKYGDIRNSDIIEVICPKCNGKRKIKRISDNNKQCVSCASSERSKQFWSNSNNRDKISTRAKQNWVQHRDRFLSLFRTDDFRGKMSRISKENWSNPEFRDKIRSLCSSDDFRGKLSVISKDLWKNDDYVAKMHHVHSSEEFRECMSRISKKSWKKYGKLLLVQLHSEQSLAKLRKVCASDDFRKKVSENSKKLWENQGYRDKMRLIWLNPEYRTRMAAVLLQQPKTSSQQEVLYSILDMMSIKYFRDSDRECKVGFYCFDCLIPVQDGLGLVKPLFIEVHGDYWHNLSKNIRRDRSKSTYLRTYFPEYELKYLWEHEFHNKDRVSNLLRYWCGIDKSELIEFDFKDVVEREVGFKESELFITKYHYAYRIRSGVNLGYYVGDELIAVIIYTRPMRRETAVKQGYSYKQVFELSRMAIHPRYQVKNLASNIIARSIRYIRGTFEEVKCLVSFSDSTYNHCGAIYLASNWRHDGEVLPDYWYADSDGYICHKKTLWNHAKSLRITESQYCDKYGYYKVWGDKKSRFVYKL